MTLTARILIVDDDATLQMALSRYLTSVGHTVSGVLSAEAALEAITNTPPDLIISDVLMPGMGGLEFCQQVRSMDNGSLISFIFLSSRGDVDERIEGHVIGADDYLVKPFDFRELAAKVTAQLNRLERIRHQLSQQMQQAKPNPLPLTPSEEKVFYEVIQGYTNKQVGDRLFLSPRTVQTHLSSILG
ncbi:MAG: response regulator, partial [Leptolyngbyaceae bacterium]|nr:response regulator [Leptolyngbyaceae bacterium]